MRITIVHRHFWPEPLTYALMLRDICLALRSDGHDVSVISVRSNPSESIDGLAGATVVRIPLSPERRDSWGRRLFNTCWYLGAIAALLLFRPRADVVLVATTPPVAPAWIVSVICRLRGSAFVYHYQDLHPESLALVGAIKQPWLVSLLARLDAHTSRRARMRIVLSEDMGRALRSRPGCEALDFRVLNNFDPTQGADVPDSAQLPGTGKRLLFAGNLGLFQGLETVVRAVASLGEQGFLSLIFVGDGALKAKLQAASGAMLGRTIFFLDRCSPERAKSFMQAADFGLVSLAPNVIRYAYPSKVMAYLSAGLPLFVVVEGGTELANLIESEQLGLICAPGDPDALAAALLQLGNLRMDRAEYRHRCRAVAAERFGASKLLAQWRSLFRGIVE